MRPWVLRALVMTVVYGLAQAAFVAARSFSPDHTSLWSVVLLGIVLAVGVAWSGAEVVLGRRPPEWTWFGAALASAPAAGLLSWILVGLFVDRSGVTDLGAALFGRAAFTALLVLGSATVGSRLGWLSLRRRGQGQEDPVLDRDETEPDAAGAGPTATIVPPPVPPTSSRTRPTGTRARPAGTRTRAAGTPAPSARPDPADRPELAEPTLAESYPEPPVAESYPEPPVAASTLEPPVVAVLPELPGSIRSPDEASSTTDEPARRRPGRRRPRT